ncbi:helix-turn-helix domain-containing protein [Nonomuraea thailandensis]
MRRQDELREFLRSRRARVTPREVGLPARTGGRRVRGLRREELALAAGVSVDYYTRMEQGASATSPTRCWRRWPESCGSAPRSCAICASSSPTGITRRRGHRPGRGPPCG